MRKTIAVLLLAAVLGIAGCSGTGSKEQPQVKKVSKEEALKMAKDATDLMNSGNIEKAKSLVETAVASNPQDAKTQLLAGVVAFNEGNFEKAIAAYKKAIEIDPKFVEPYNNLGNTYRNMKNYAEAAKWYEKATTVDARFNFAWSNWALMLIERENKLAEGVAVLNKAIATNPENLDLRMTLAQAYADANQKDKAVETLEATLKVQPNFKPAADLLQQLKDAK